MEAIFSKTPNHVVTLLFGVILFSLGLISVPHVALANVVDSTGVAANVSYSRTNPVVPISRSWYGDSLNLLSTQTFQDRYFDGRNVGIEMTASCPIDGSFTVSLFRISNGRASLVGSASFKRNGFTKATWENVGSGTYRFLCKKTLDGKRVTSTDVAIYSW